MNTGIAHQLPDLARRVLYLPGIIDTALESRYGPKVGRQSVGGLLTGDACHLHFHTEALVLDADLAHAAASPFRSSSSTARIRWPMASMTLTVTPLPACL